MVSAGSHREDAETARACRVGRQWGQRAAWWSLGAPPGGALPCQEDDAAPAHCRALRHRRTLSGLLKLRFWVCPADHSLPINQIFLSTALVTLVSTELEYLVL
ncbi:unnamed protein product [Rangifer tarandus platyrhynchus]|uniref:Uncharacterized protein n=1 Tax=Rangifer tarandus platyrhynchus TaxID=3082113 RepID=A0ABN8YPB3_RANTA|nr:unnamed protein product [Rangifer tarandus platyrhynchus]